MTKNPLFTPEQLSQTLEQVNARVGKVSVSDEWDFSDEALRILAKYKPIMEKRKLRKATINCRFCGGKDTLFMFLGTRPHRGHLPFHFQCRTEGCNFMLIT